MTHNMTMRDAVAWIADNDEPGHPKALEPYHVVSQVSVQLIADISGNEPITIARRVVKLREESERLQDFNSENLHGFHTPRGDWPDRPTEDPYPEARRERRLDTEER